MKYAREVIAAMRPYPGREFRMGDLVRVVSRRRALSAAEAVPIRKGIKRVLDELMEIGLVAQVGGNTKAALYVWRGYVPNGPSHHCRAGQYLRQ